MASPILLLDNNAIRHFANPALPPRLQSNLRTTGREFWPSAMNAMEALAASDEEIRRRQLRILHLLAGDNFALTLPTEALKRIAQSWVDQNPEIDYSDRGVTVVIRDPDAASAALIKKTREHLRKQEVSFRTVHERARQKLRPALLAAGGRTSWPNVRAFLDEIWCSPSHLGSYIMSLWQEWGFPGEAPVEMMLQDDAWRIFFEGWGAAFYAHSIAHPQPRWVETADLQQLVYLGIHRNAVFATDDVGLQDLGAAIVHGKYGLRQVVSVQTLIA